MKNYMLLFFAALFVGCAPTGVQVTFDDENSNKIREHLNNYVNNDLDSLLALASDDAQIFINGEDPMTPDEMRPLLEAQHAIFDNITLSWVQEGKEDIGVWVESTTYPEGPANYPADVTTAWFNWLGTSKMSGETITIPVHVVYVWNDEGKIQAEYEYYDPTKLVAAMEAAQSAAMQ